MITPPLGAERRKEMRKRKKINRRLPVVYFDMDGVLSKWREVPVEETYRPGFFWEGEVEWGLISLIYTLEAVGFEVRILSAAYNPRTRREKRRWLIDILPRLKPWDSPQK